MDEKALYFEEIEVGHKWKSARRTITETDIVQFAGLSGDWNPLHTDEEFAKTTIFGRRIAHGLLGLSVCSGLQTSEPTWVVMAFMGLDWKFKKPIFIGDTVHYVSEVKQKREMKQGGRGIVVMDRKLVNQNEEVVQDGSFTLLIQKREK